METDGSLKSSADKFYSPEDLKLWVEDAGAHRAIFFDPCGAIKRIPCLPFGASS
jgi:hypothetical protein